MKTFLYPGSFDPPTLGHEDIALRAGALCDRLIVAVMDNAQKSRHLFDAQQRVEMLRELFSDVPNITVVRSEGLLADLCRESGADAVVRGLRNAADLSQEMLMASVNARIGDVETIFFATRDAFANISSSVVRELLSYGRDVSAFIPEKIRHCIHDDR